MDGCLQVTALNGTTGAQVWSIANNISFTGGPSLSWDGSHLFVTGDIMTPYYPELYALSAYTGTVVWAAVPDNEDILVNPTAGPSGAVFVGSITGCMYAFQGATGARLWKYCTSQPPVYPASDGLNIFSQPSLSRDASILYFGCEDGALYAVRADSGAFLWSFMTGGPVFSSPSVHPDGRVLVGSDDFYVRALNGTTGALLWAVPMECPVRSTPAIGQHGTVFVGKCQWVMARAGRQACECD
jgi:outer membrane protein assembly factor BamB